MQPVPGGRMSLPMQTCAHELTHPTRLPRHKCITLQRARACAALRMSVPNAAYLYPMQPCTHAIP